MRLALADDPGFAREDIVVSAGNAEAVALIDAWPSWPGGGVALIGPAGAGKSHLARAWATKAGAAVVTPADRTLPETGAAAVLVEDADHDRPEEFLFHLFNRSGEGQTLLLTGRAAPSEWTVALPDLASRLAGLVVARLGPPDDVVLEGVLRRLFRARNIRPGDDLLPYLLRRMERSVAAAQDVVSRLDELADTQGREVNRALARQLFEQNESGDLFD